VELAYRQCGNIGMLTLVPVPGNNSLRAAVSRLVPVGEANLGVNLAIGDANLRVIDQHLRTASLSAIVICCERPVVPILGAEGVGPAFSRTEVAELLHSVILTAARDAQLLYAVPAHCVRKITSCRPTDIGRREACGAPHRRGPHHH
jgi:hypothetical protein